MNPHSEPLSVRYHRAHLKWCDLENAAAILEDTKSIVFSQMMLKHGSIAVNRAEIMVKASAEWQEHVEKICAARYEANKAKAELEYLKMRGWEETSRAADNRLQARL